MWTPAIFDELLSIDWVSRLTTGEILSLLWIPGSTGGRVPEIHRAMAKLEALSHRIATGDELVAELDISKDELKWSLRKLAWLKTVRRDGLWSVSVLPDEEVWLHDIFPGGYGPEAQALLDQGEMRTRIAEAMAASHKEDRLLLALYYYLHLTLHEIGHVIGLADQAVPIFFATAVLRLRSGLPELAGLAEDSKQGTASRQPLDFVVSEHPSQHLEFRQSCGADELCHVLVARSPYRYTLCGQRWQPVTNSHQIGKCPNGFRLCPACGGIGDWDRPYGGPPYGSR